MATGLTEHSVDTQSNPVEGGCFSHQTQSPNSVAGDSETGPIPSSRNSVVISSSGGICVMGAYFTRWRVLFITYITI